MTKDELADHFKAGFDDLEAHIDALPDGQLKARAEVLAEVMHRAADRLKALAVGDGLIQPYSGGTPKG